MKRKQPTIKEKMSREELKMVEEYVDVSTTSIDTPEIHLQTQKYMQNTS